MVSLEHYSKGTLNNLPLPQMAVGFLASYTHTLSGSLAKKRLIGLAKMTP